MKLRCILLIASLLSAGDIAGAQQNANKPVLSATPAVAGGTNASAGSVQASQPPAALMSVSDDYVIAPADSIEVTVWKEPVLSGTFPVRPDGRISLALIGDLPAAGFTPTQLGDDITNRLKKYVNDPRVTVTILGVHVDKVFILGEVGHVGPVAINADMTPLQAIAAAGGLTPYANGKRIYILRKSKGQEIKIPFNYKKAVKDGDLQGVSLLPGDTVVVP